MIKLTKIFSISLPDYVFNKYVIDVKGNRSKFIEEMLVRGIEAESGEIKEFKTKYLELIKEIRDKSEENRQLRAKLGKNLAILEKTEQEQAIINSPLDKCIECGGFYEDNGHKFANGIVCGACFMNGNLAKMKKWGL